jgi:hypothetical protein
VLAKYKTEQIMLYARTRLIMPSEIPPPPAWALSVALHRMLNNEMFVQPQVDRRCDRLAPGGPFGRDQEDCQGPTARR